MFVYFWMTFVWNAAQSIIHSYQWRIQDFKEWGASAQEMEASTYYFDFSKKVLENWPGRRNFWIHKWSPGDQIPHTHDKGPRFNLEGSRRQTFLKTK